MMWLTRAAAIAGFAAVAYGLFWGSYLLFKTQELEKAQARLTLYSSAVQAELESFAHLPFVLSLDPVVTRTLAGADPETLNQRLRRIAHSAEVEAIYLMDATGLTIAASNAGTAGSFLGQNYGYRPYFQAALRGELGEFYGIGATTGIPGYFYAMAVQTEGSPTGVIAIKLDLASLQDGWQASGERFMLSNANGIVLLASNPAWRYRVLAPLPSNTQRALAATRQFADEPLTPLGWRPDDTRQTATIDGENFLYLRTGDLPNSWSLHFLMPDDVARTRAWLSTGSFVLAAGALLFVWQLRRARQVRRDLTRSESEESQLRAANARLAVEIEERRAAERSLKKTQAELERAGRLAALGQLASSVTHELGQPIAAMRNQLAAAELSDGATRLNGKMQTLVARMEEITRQLKFFSRKGRDQFEEVACADVIRTALELLEPNIQTLGAQVHFDPGPAGATLLGNRMRLEQVVTNLVRNALDAVEGGAQRQIDITIGEDATTLWIEVADTGHGLRDKTLDDLREPFATSRESGKGMGLGLTISAGIISDHGGVLTADDRPGGGAIFRAVFEKQKEETPS
ncbi:ATP-binding protein [Cognatishimia sp. SS12]|uniref:sensor histidine kinase n=1 Tax=Cognatishimia sp. SS12 TaxID=2979465 RepID=UPI00232CAB55|nr:ATP-binding protein [Cognatishimia sp. SS12]MDC0739322.1 ATP-binding protein [Cognatishimia sp. SS12]